MLNQHSCLSYVVDSVNIVSYTIVYMNDSVHFHLWQSYDNQVMTYIYVNLFIRR